jgi:hypothetical protein
MPRRKDGSIPGGRVLALAGNWLGRHCRYPDDESRHAATLWGLSTHFRGSDQKMIWDAHGRLLIVAMPESGKTTAMELEGALCTPYFFGIDTNPTGPGLCHSLSEENAVMFLDEVHRMFGAKGTRKPDVVAILNSGYRPRGTVTNGRGGTTTRVPVWGAVALAGHMKLLRSAADELADLIGRCIAIKMEPVPEGEEPPAKVTRAVLAHGEGIAALAAEWAAQEIADGNVGPAQERAQAAAAGAGLRDGTRAMEIWLPPLTVAALASDAHLETAVAAAQVLHGRRPSTDAQTRIEALEEIYGGDGW